MAKPLKIPLKYIYIVTYYIETSNLSTEKGVSPSKNCLYGYECQNTASTIKLQREFNGTNSVIKQTL